MRLILSILFMILFYTVGKSAGDTFFLGWVFACISLALHRAMMQD